MGRGGLNAGHEGCATEACDAVAALGIFAFAVGFPFGLTMVALS